MFKKLFGALSKPPAIPEKETVTYEVPASLPALDPEMDGVLAKMDLPDSIKQYMTPKPAVEVSEWGEPLLEEAASDAGKAVTEEMESQVGEAMVNAVNEANGESTPFLTELLKDPRFALISVKFLSFGLSKESAVLWAAEAASLSYAIGQEQDPTAPVMPPAEEKAAAQAKMFAEGSPFSPKEADLATQEAGFDTPGGMAAQAASWSVEPPPVDPEIQEGLIGNLINGAVLLAAAMTMPDFKLDPSSPETEFDVSGAPPELKAAPLIEEDPEKAMPMAKTLKPFIDKGLQIAATA